MKAIRSIALVLMMALILLLTIRVSGHKHAMGLLVLGLILLYIVAILI